MTKGSQTKVSLASLFLTERTPCMAKPLLYLFLLIFANSLSAQQAEKVGLLARWDDQSLLINGTARYNDCWGFVQHGVEYAVLGSTEGTHIIELTPDHQTIQRDFVRGRHSESNVVHRDHAVYRNFLYAVCDQGVSSLQAIDLSYLPDSVHVTHDDTTIIIRAHNVFVDSFAAKLYVCGPHFNAMSIFDLSADPSHPQLLAHFNGVEYVHDVYVRRDTAYLNAGNQGLWVYDFSNAAAPQALGSLEFYPEQGYNHSGWLSPDGNTYVFADETGGKRMKVCDVSDLSDIRIKGFFNSGMHPETVPHNLQIKGRYVFVSHYNDGLRIFDISDPSNPLQTAWYDTYPGSDETAHFRGAWGIYSYLPSGRILISDRQTGLYVFRFAEPPNINSSLEHGVFPNPFRDEAWFIFDNPLNLQYELLVYDSRGRQVQRYSTITDGYVRLFSAALRTGLYHYELRGINVDRREFGKFVVD